MHVPNYRLTPTPVPTWTAIPEPTPTATNTPIPILAITPFPEPTVVPTPVLTPTPMVYPYPITTQDAIENLEFTLDSFSREVDYTWDCDHRKPKEDNTYILKSACEGTAKTEITVIYALLTVIYLHEGYVTIVLSLVEGEEDDTVVNYALCASTNPCMS